MPSSSASSDSPSAALAAAASRAAAFRFEVPEVEGQQHAPAAAGGERAQATQVPFADRRRGPRRPRILGIDPGHVFVGRHAAEPHHPRTERAQQRDEVPVVGVPRQLRRGCRPRRTARGSRWAPPAPERSVRSRRSSVVAPVCGGGGLCLAAPAGAGAHEQRERGTRSASSSSRRRGDRGAFVWGACIRGSLSACARRSAPDGRGPPPARPRHPGRRCPPAPRLTGPGAARRERG